MTENGNDRGAAGANGAEARGTAANLLFLHAQTSMHPGSGTALGVIDLPIQRERHTQWPVIPASSLKGVLRAACREANGGGGDLWLEAFGPETDNAGDHAGAVAVTDARILAFPVRSLCGVFAWVTAPAVLERAKRDAKLAGIEADFAIPEPLDGQMACGEKAPILIKDTAKAVLEEYEFERIAGLDSGPAANAANWIATNVFDSDDTAARLRQHLVVLSDDDFTYFVRHATEVNARIGLDYERKTVKQGALFYQEFLPPETLLYAVVMVNDSRKKASKTTSADLADFLKQTLPAVVQLGGDETTGKGLCTVKWVTSREAS